MEKIERIIEECNDCRYKRRYKWEGSNCDFLDVCCYREEHTLNEASVLLITGNSDTHIIEIPANCPLEDYKITK